MWFSQAKAKMVPGPVLGYMDFGRTKAVYCLGESQLSFPPPAQKPWKKRSKTKPERALKQVRGPFSCGWLCGSRGGALELGWALPHTPAAALLLLCLLAPKQKRCSSEEWGKDCQWQRGAGCARLMPKLAYLPP